MTVRQGVKPLADRDWLFGSRPRRLALEALLRAQDERWSKAALTRAASVSPHGGIDEHLAGFIRIGLVVERDGAYALADPPPAFVGSLAALLTALGGLPDRPPS